MRFLPHAHRISLLSPAPVSHIFHSCRPSMPRKQKAALVPTPIKQSHEAMVVSYRPQTLHDTIHTVLPGEVLPAIPSYLEFITVRLFVFQLTASRRGWRRFRFYRHLCSNISTHSLTKRLTRRVPTFVFFVVFQLTASRRGWRTIGKCWQQNRTFQLTASRRGWLYTLFNSPYIETISTHSLTKRLTFTTFFFCYFYFISTHSLTKRLTSWINI